jgi:hypothetical protein
LVLELEVPFVLHQGTIQTYQVHDYRGANKKRAQRYGFQEFEDVLAVVLFTSSVEGDVDLVDDNFSIEEREDGDRDDTGADGVEDDEEEVLDLEDEVVESFALDQNEGDDEGEEDDVDGKVGHRDGSEVLVELLGVLKLNDVHSASGLDVLPDVEVPEHEHGNEEADEEDLAEEGEDHDEQLALGVVVLIDPRLANEGVEDVQECVVETLDLHLYEDVAETQDHHESEEESSEGGEVLADLRNHLGHHHNNVAELLVAFQQEDGDEAEQENMDRYQHLDAVRTPIVHHHLVPLPHLQLLLLTQIDMGTTYFKDWVVRLSIRTHYFHDEHQAIHKQKQIHDDHEAIDLGILLEFEDGQFLEHTDEHGNGGIVH